ncbi:hypothetical protein HaLaN_21022, partial [Haematococcus lacustris]
MSHGRVGCINCGKHRLYIAEVKLHSMGARHPKQLARSGSTVQDSADSVQQEASSKAHKAQPPGALAVGLSARLLRLVSTLDALPSLVTLCTVEGQ